ncbi:Quinolinate synthase A [Anaerohalosphaera lusitana]|uniref:Quinolinate synthase n=1 Tax=Anaerohalosphaera lusitana TaxID=1936003 RepID=A0A1U9NQ04_9BACT|nr:quinolinate synthase NadA [Anaerohalosphaera lusitana]AQT69596.1 Quinolinate synthase A [Anaerohalosphaera lusitana]
MSNLVEKIEKLKKERNAVILAHNYQIGEVQDIADYTGDSLGLSVQAAQTKADVIVFCGVLFMAETAYILSPDKTVLLPEKNAGCPMADMITAADLQKLKDQHPDALVVTYVNSPAEVKALSDYCCTSGNAVELVSTLPKDRKIIFCPDQHLGSYVMQQTGREMILWPGYCPTHVRITSEDVEAAKNQHPGAVVLTHPECSSDVKRASDELLSTGQMIKYAENSDVKKFIIVTEQGILHTLRKKMPNKEFIGVSDKMICPNMKKIDLAKVAWSLEDMKHQITVPDEIRIKAKGSLDRMLEVLPKK